MIYIKFNIKEEAKYTDFLKLFKHMVATRQPDYEKKVEEEPPEVDYETMSDEEIQETYDKINDFDPDKIRYERFIPNYADTFIRKYVNYDETNFGQLSFKDVEAIFNYLEYSFEVEMDAIKKTSENEGIIEISAYNFPFGGLDRFLITLKAFNLIPTEYFNGFTVMAFTWLTDFEYDALELPEKTKAYLKKKHQ